MKKYYVTLTLLLFTGTAWSGIRTEGDAFGDGRDNIIASQREGGLNGGGGGKPKRHFYHDRRFPDKYGAGHAGQKVASRLFVPLLVGLADVELQSELE